ncbi:MAG: Ig-like domain-containing protein [Clostridia bacterium]|nr:Ig-like domain-containing protein [Clostridia bacterium]
MKRKILSLLCVLTMAAAMIPTAALAEETYFNAQWFDGNAETRKVQAEVDANIAEIHGTRAADTVRKTSTATNTYLKLSDTYDDADKPYVRYEIFAEKSGMYMMYIKSNTPAISSSGNYTMHSPYAVEINNAGAFSIDGSIHTENALGQTNLIGTTYYKEGTTHYQYARFSVPVYLNEGKNDIKFVVTGKRGVDATYNFQLDFFTFEYMNDGAEIIVNAEDTIGGNASIADVAESNATGGKYYYLYKNNSTENVYADYAVYAPVEGEYELEFAGTHPRTYLSGFSVAVNGKKFVTHGGVDETTGYPDATISDDVTTEAITAPDFMKYTTKETVHLNKGVNIVRAQTETPNRQSSTASRVLFGLDYIKFTSAVMPAVEAETITTNVLDGSACGRIPTTGSSGEMLYMINIPATKDTESGLYNTIGAAELKYTVNVPVEGNYDMYIDMCGYVEADDVNYSYRAPIKMKVDNGDAQRLAAEGTYTNKDKSTTHLEGNITKAANLDVGTAYDHIIAAAVAGYFGKYKLNTPLNLTAGLHEITFIVDDVAANSVALAALDKFELKMEQTANTVVVKAYDNTLTEGEMTAVTANVFDAHGILMEGDVTYTSSAPEIASVDESGNITANNVGRAIITATANGKMATTEIYVYDADNKFVILGAEKLSDGVNVKSVIGDTELTSVPELIAATYHDVIGTDSTLDDVGTVHMTVGNNGSVSNTKIEVENMTKNAVVFAWDSLKGMIPLYGKTIAE